MIIGIGNPLRGDDGVGSRIAERFEGRWGVEALSVHQLTPELADPVSRADVVVFVDARVDSSRPAGDVRVESLGLDASHDNLSHATSACQVLAYAQGVFGRRPEALLVSVSARQFELGANLSAEVERAIPAACAAIERAIDPSSQTRQIDLVQS